MEFAHFAFTCIFAILFQLTGQFGCLKRQRLRRPCVLATEIRADVNDQQVFPDSKRYSCSVKERKGNTTTMSAQSKIKKNVLDMQTKVKKGKSKLPVDYSLKTCRSQDVSSLEIINSKMAADVLDFSSETFDKSSDTLYGLESNMPSVYYISEDINDIVKPAEKKDLNLPQPSVVK